MSLQVSLTVRFAATTAPVLAAGVLLAFSPDSARAMAFQGACEVAKVNASAERDRVGHLLDD